MTINFKIQEFNRDTRDERRLIYEGTLSGDPVTDSNKVVKQFIDANEKRLETYNKMRRVYLAARELGMTKREISEIFNDRGAGDLLKYIERGRFKPFNISDNMKEKYRELAKEKGILVVAAAGNYT